MKIEDLKEKLYQLNEKIKLILEECEYSKKYDLVIDYNPDNLEECMMYYAFSSLFTHLDYIHYVVGYIQKPIIEEGIVTVDDIGVYKLNGIVLNKNDVVEVLRTEVEEYWDIIVVSDIHRLEGVRVRLRG